MHALPKKVKKRFYLDYGLLIPYLILSIVGIIMVYSASSYKLMQDGANPASAAIRQAAYLVVGLVAVMFIYKMKVSVFQNRRFIMFAIAVISFMLLLTRFTSLGSRAGGAMGWLSLGPVRIQPAEFLKIMVVWYLAYILARRQDMINQHFKEATLKPIVLVSGLIFLVLIQPDFGGAAILVLITLIMLLASGVNYMYTLVVGGGGVVLSFIMVQLIVLTRGIFFPGRLKYIYRRFETFVNPFSDPLNNGLQMINSYYAINNGGWFGRGIGNSIQKKGFLPEAQTDFMFSIVIEELGLLIALVLLGLLLFLILRIFLIGIRSKNAFNSLMCIGIGSMILIQTFVNVGGIAGIIPLTGVTFPFLSQGGSSLIVLSIAVGFALNISADEKRRQHYRQIEMLKTTFQENKQLLNSRD